jgi:uncharacterized membrane protein (DUF4010 family)
MVVGAASYIALRAVGSRLGLALAGFVGGFISASATIGSMGNRAKRSPELRGAAASGAVLATVATIVQMFIVLLVTNVATCRALAMPLLFSGLAASGLSRSKHYQAPHVCHASPKRTLAHSTANPGINSIVLPHPH